MIDAAVENAIILLSQTLQFQHTPFPNHDLVIVTGWNQTPIVRRAVAEYLVGLRVMAVNSVLAVRTDLVGPSGLAEVRQNVEAVIGVNGAGLTADQVIKSRDPWIAEGIWHLCLAASILVPGIHPHGAVFSLSLPHADATEHGIDIAVLHQAQNGIGLSIVETKAYRNDPAEAVRRAAQFFRGINEGAYRIKIREAVQRMRSNCPPPLQNQITAQLWEEHRWYIPNPHYDDVHAANWTLNRPVLTNLLNAPANPGNPPLPVPQGIVIMPHAATEFDAYFDGIAADMMAFVNTL